MEIINKIKLWFWWHFRATEMEKDNWTLITKGTLIKKSGERINPKKFFIEPKAH